jgi:hypothetical protein
MDSPADIAVSAPAYSVPDEDTDPLASMEPAAEVAEETATEETPEPKSDSKTVKSLEILQKHRPEDFEAACDSQGIPLAMWKDAPAALLKELLAALN